MTRIAEIILMIPALCGLTMSVALFVIILACTLDTILGSIASVSRGRILNLNTYEGMFMPYSRLKKILRVNTWLGILGRLVLLYGAALVATGIIAIATGFADRFLVR